jgi:hypothetical protein
MLRVEALQNIYELVDGNKRPQMDHSFDVQLKKLGILSDTPHFFRTEKLKIKVTKKVKSPNDLLKEINLFKHGFKEGDEGIIKFDFASNPPKILIKHNEKINLNDRPPKDPKVDHYFDLIHCEVRLAREEIKRQTINSATMDEKVGIIKEYIDSLERLSGKAKIMKNFFYESEKESDWLIYCLFESGIANFITYLKSEYKNLLNSPLSLISVGTSNNEFKPQGYSNTSYSVKQLAGKYAVSERKMYRFINGKSNQDNLILKKGRTCFIKNKCDNKIQKMLE